MALQCDVTTSDGIAVTGAYIRPQFEVRKKFDLNEGKQSYLFVQCEVYVSETVANTDGGRRLQARNVGRFRGAWDTAGGSLEAQGYALMKAQSALADATDV